MEPALLEDVPLFSLFDEEERKALATAFNNRTIRKGEVIFNAGDPGDCLYLLHHGKIEIFVKDKTGEKIIFAELDQPGDIFGELAIFDKGARSASAMALEDSQTLVLNRPALELFIRTKPDAAMDLMAIMARRIRNADMLIRGRAARNPNEEFEEVQSWVQRLAYFIAEFSGSMTFLFINAAIFTTWIVINLDLVPGIAAFDPYPFGFLTMSVSLEAIFLSIFVLLAQNIQSAKERVRGDIEYEVNLKAELEISHLHEKVEQMNEEILARLQRIENVQR